MTTIHEADVVRMASAGSPAPGTPPPPGRPGARSVGLDCGWREGPDVQRLPPTDSAIFTRNLCCCCL